MVPAPRAIDKTMTINLFQSVEYPFPFTRKLNLNEGSKENLFEIFIDNLHQMFLKQDIVMSSPRLRNS